MITLSLLNRRNDTWRIAIASTKEAIAALDTTPDAKKELMDMLASRDDHREATTVKVSIKHFASANDAKAALQAYIDQARKLGLRDYGPIEDRIDADTGEVYGFRASHRTPRPSAQSALDALSVFA